MTIDFKATSKQYTAITYLLDNKTTEILYGGSAGSGKTTLGVAFIIMSALKYPGTRYAIARSRLSVLKNTTIKTFIDMAKEWNIEHLIDYNLFLNNIKFKNGSEILLLDLFLYPSDADFNRLGSLELTAVLIDEAAEISERAYTILKTRIRYKLNEYNLIPKVFIVSNPARGWLYEKFYKANRDNVLEQGRVFIQALPTDNPHLPSSYLEVLKSLPSIDRKRLYEGQWEFTSTDYDLFEIDKLYETFNKELLSGENYITADIASTGGDKTVIVVWDGFTAIKIDKYSQIDTNEIVKKIRKRMIDFGVPIKNVIVDAIGVGVGVADNLKCQRFIAGSRVFNDEPFLNLKSQVYFKFAEMVNSGQVSIKSEAVDEIIDELSFHKRYKPEADGKFRVTPKDLVKRSISRSPDTSDALVMRMYWCYKKERVKTTIF